MIQKIKNILISFKEIVLKKYPVTLAAIWIGTLLLAIVVDTDAGKIQEFLERSLMFVWVFAIGSACTEEIFHKKRVGKLCGIGVSALVAGWYLFLTIYKGETLFGLSMEKVVECFAKLLACYIVWAMAVFLYHRIRQSGQKICAFAIHVFGNVMKISVVYGILAIGLAIIVLIFNLLIFDTDTFLLRIEVALVCGMYLPGIILAVADTQKEIGKFIRFLVKYVLQSLLIIAFTIIYIYILKLVVTFSLPSNQVFSILAFLFICGLPIWTMAAYYEEDLQGKIAKLLPYVFAPFIILQILCVGMRIHQYGLTQSRYMGVLLIILENGYLLLYSIKKQKFLSCIFFVAAMLFTGYLIIPGISAEDVVFTSQKGRLEQYLEMPEGEREGIDKETAKKIHGAASEVSYTKRGDAYLETLTQSDKDFLEKCRKLAYSYGDENIDVSEIKTYINARSYVQDFSVAGYDRLYMVNQIDDNADVKNFAFGCGEMQISMDFSKFIEDIKEVYDEDERYKANDWLAANREIKVPGGGKLVLNTVDIIFQGEDVTRFAFSGYYLK